MEPLSLWTELAGSLRLALSLWNTKESTKYFDELMELEEERDNELNKPEYEGESGEIPKELRKDYMDHANLDDLDRRLCLLSRAIGAKARGADSVSK